MNITKTLELLLKYAQVLYNDYMMNLSEDENIASSSRQELIISMIRLLREQIDTIEQHMNQNSVQ